MLLDNEEQRALILQCIHATVPMAVRGADDKSVAQLLQLSALRQAVEQAQVAGTAGTTGAGERAPAEAVG